MLSTNNTATNNIDMTHKMENNKYESYHQTYAKCESTHAGSYESGYDSEPGLSSSDLHSSHDDRSTYAKNGDDVIDDAHANYDHSDWSEKDFFYEEEFNRFNYDIENLEELCQSANGVVYTGNLISTGDDVIVSPVIGTAFKATGKHFLIHWDLFLQIFHQAGWLCSSAAVTTNQRRWWGRFLNTEFLISLLSGIIL